MGKATQDDCKAATSDLNELEALLMRCRAVRDDANKEVDRFIRSHDELSETLARLNTKNNRNQVCLVSNFPHWLKEAIQYFKIITSDVPQVLWAFGNFDLDAMKDKLNSFETNFNLTEPSDPR